jgi:hypothetical protein
LVRRAQAGDFGADPAGVRRARQNELSKTLFLDWFLRGAQGSRSNFLYLRQSFASHLAALAALHVVFSPRPSPEPCLAVIEDRQRVLFPGFFELAAYQGQVREFAVHLPLTEQIGEALPAYVLKGSFATSWHTVVGEVARDIDKLRIMLHVFLETQEHRCPEAIEARVARVTKMAQQIGEDTDKYDDPFQFALFDHLVECSATALAAQMIRTGWI